METHRSSYDTVEHIYRIRGAILEGQRMSHTQRERERSGLDLGNIRHLAPNPLLWEWVVGTGGKELF